MESNTGIYGKTKERERKMCEVPLSWQESVHYAKWLLKSGTHVVKEMQHNYIHL